MKYIDVVKEAKTSGQWNEKTMWLSVEHISELLGEIKDAHPELYWQFMRKEAGLMSGYHYNEKWANHDVEKMEWKDRDGKTHHGAYWTMEQVEDAVKGKTFPSGVTKYDRYVAYNASATDMCSVFTDAQILDAAYAMWFNDVDWSNKGSGTKIWEYMCCKYSM